MNRSSASYLIVLGLFFLPMYLLTTNQIFSFDAVTNAIACESNEPIRWFHPNHPLYPFLGVVYYRLERLLGYEGLALYSLARFNSILVTTGLLLLFHTLSQYITRAKAFLAVAALGSTYAVWHYAVDGRAIGTVVFFSSLLIWYVVKIDHQARTTRPNQAALAGLSALYVAAHGIGIFHVPALLWWLNKKHPGDFRPIAWYTGILSLVLASGFLSIYVFIVPETSSSFLSWLLGYAGFQGTGKIGSSQFWAQSIGGAATGFWLGWRNAWIPVLPSNSVAINYASNLTGLLTLFGTIFFMVRVSLTGNMVSPLLRFLFIWGMLSLLFLLLWSPGQEGFRLHMLIPWFVMGAIALGNKAYFKWGAGVRAALLLGANIAGPISHAATIQNNTGFQLLRALDDQVEKGSLFLSADSGFISNLEVYQPYFFPHMKGGTLSGRLFAFRETSLDPLKARLAMMLSSGIPIYWGGDLFDPLIQERLESRFGLASGEISEMLRFFSPQPAFSLTKGKMVYVTRPH